MKLIINNEEKFFDKPIKLVDIAPRNYFCAKVNNTLRELSYEPKDNSVIELLDLTNPDAVRIYEATLRYILVWAIKNLYKNVNVRINYTVSMALFIDIQGLNKRIDRNITNEITAEMNRIIDADYKIEKIIVSKQEAKKLYEQMGFLDKWDMLDYRPEKDVHIYKCEDYYNYMFTYMAPSTGYIKDFKLFPYYPQMILQYPRSETFGKIPEFNASLKYAKTLARAKAWSQTQEIANISDLNNRLKNESVSDFINLCEAKHARTIAKIGDKIEENKSELKLIAIAGPSSSGKTTFSNKIRIELMSRGFKPVMISLDNYYKNYVDIIPDENGKKDLEDVDALDIDLFNKNMLDLIGGLEVEIPHYDFKTQRRIGGELVKLDENGIIIIEGIHALSEQMSYLIPRDQKFKIFISPQQQINIDDANPIRITDIRLIRRAVRDNLYRNYDVNKTLDIWPSVRSGEFKWIYHYQEDADYIFNSELAYELCVLKKYAYPLFTSVSRDNPNYIAANRIAKFLKYFIEIDETFIPCNSLLKEFIGGSCFE